MIFQRGLVYTVLVFDQLFLKFFLLYSCVFEAFASALRFFCFPETFFFVLFFEFIGWAFYYFLHHLMDKGITKNFLCLSPYGEGKG